MRTSELKIQAHIRSRIPAWRGLLKALVDSPAGESGRDGDLGDEHLVFDEELAVAALQRRRRRRG
jgi:hypothetical protein